ncbi:S-adenosyl-L-methionine-dependent methyltransferase [Lophiotrema nucula]|uniref:tRNA(Phe) (4-demethylwyosine(37)-C(7)) aminocarboxypropyltransferase n=1 Tax=Lophiotrema nucula TaxID=690887 RepID=A0A6A5ZRA8_9PLEO|nr:S-adenosyl-L-methionine-dependent methyltransferase [Lophiotrema nucula]
MAPMTDGQEQITASRPAIQEYRKCLVVPRTYVKRIKTKLEKYSQLDKSVKIVQEPDPLHEEDGYQRNERQLRMVIPTTVKFTQFKGDDDAIFQAFMAQDNRLGNVIQELELEGLIKSGDISIIDKPLSEGNAPEQRTPLLKALEESLGELPQELFVSLGLTIETLVDAFPSTYSVYRPMLLLPAHAFDNPSWQKLLLSNSPESPQLQGIWKRLAEATKTTHVAINAGIPLNNTPSQPTSQDSPEENILRSPMNLTPLYGDFGPSPTPQLLSNPTEEDFNKAFWVSCTQNGIHQTWAPRFSMFSRGNIKEKTRLLTLPSVKETVEEGCTALDLYAGIGYFAFSYKRAGASKVLCWELNPWSIEGLRRGANMNHWTSQIFQAEAYMADGWIEQVKDVDFLIFQESNEAALCPIFCLVWKAPKNAVPPIRHVNCGFLPSSKQSWQTAVRSLDTRLGGWIHAHENVGVNDIDKRKEEVVNELQYKVDYWEAERGCCGSYRRRVRCEHVERVKTYAPGVIHVVFDMKVDGQVDAEDLLA